MATPTGEQFEITRPSADGISRAIITELAATLRVLEVNETALVESFPEHSVSPYGSGIVLVPWPNRVEDGIWHLDGVKQQLDLTEPAARNAIHGLLRNTAYRVVDRAPDSVTLAATIFPQHGYPFQLDTTVTYALVDGGLSITHDLHNAGDAAAPVAVGAHPYLRVGDVPVEDLTLTLAAATHFEVDDRLNPIAEHPVDGTSFDLRAGSIVGALQLDDGFGGVESDWAHRLTAPDGRFVEVWGDPDYKFVQVFVNRSFPKEGGFGTAIAVEPMTAPAGALVSGQGLRWLQPGESWSVSWGIRYSGLAQGSGLGSPEA